MTYNKIDELPAEITEQLPQHAQQIFLAAFNAAQSDGMSEDGAKSVAWNSVSQMVNGIKKQKILQYTINLPYLEVIRNNDRFADTL